jgi:hypothetical protein
MGENLQSRNKRDPPAKNEEQMGELFKQGQVNIRPGNFTTIQKRADKDYRP